MATVTPVSSNTGGASATNANSQNMYRVGDYVYFENSASSTYAIRRIEELNRTGNGNVEARVMCFYRRSEVPPGLLKQADKHHFGDNSYNSSSQNETNADKSSGLDPSDSDDDEADDKNSEHAQMKMREVYLSRQVETLPATLIRGKCSVTLLSEVETPQSYLSRDDAFFYALVYDPHAKTIVADRGEIRIGSSYQATVPAVLGEDEDDGRGEGDKDGNGVLLPDLEERKWMPIWEGSSNKLNDSEIDKFLIISRSVGTFARALDCSSSVKQPSLHMSAAAASRDVTLFHAHNLLHKHDYDISEALKALVPTTGKLTNTQL